MSEAEEAPYGYCPRCFAPGYSRERRPNGNDLCERGHQYPSAAALPERPTKPAEVAVLQAGRLSAQQVLAGTLYDGNADQIANVVVCVQLKEGGEVYINHSNMSHADLAYIGVILQKHILKTL